MALLETAAMRISASSRFTRYRGDGWQIFLKDPGQFLWAAVYLNAVLKADPDGLPTRISIGLGTVETLGPRDLSQSSGSAFVHSGRALDALHGKGRTLILTGEATDAIQRSLVAFIEDRMQSWSREQAEVVALKLLPDDLPTQKEISATLGISRQAVAARLEAAGFALISNACVAFHDHFAPSVAQGSPP
jgi:hypothetical protein